MYLAMYICTKKVIANSRAKTLPAGIIASSYTLTLPINAHAACIIVARTHTRMHTHTYTRTHAHTHTHTHIRNTHTYTRTHTHMDAHTHTHTRMHACMGTCEYKNITIIKSFGCKDQSSTRILTISIVKH